MESHPILNRELLMESSGGDLDFAKELFGDLKIRAQQLRDEMFAAVSAQSAERLKKAAHELKGSCLTLGAERLANVSRQLEQQGHQANLSESPALLSSLDEELVQLWGHLDAEELIA